MLDAQHGRLSVPIGWPDRLDHPAAAAVEAPVQPAYLLQAAMVDGYRWLQVRDWRCADGLLGFVHLACGPGDVVIWGRIAVGKPRQRRSA